MVQSQKQTLKGLRNQIWYCGKTIGRAFSVSGLDPCHEADRTERERGSIRVVRLLDGRHQRLTAVSPHHGNLEYRSSNPPRMVSIIAAHRTYLENGKNKQKHKPQPALWLHLAETTTPQCRKRLSLPNWDGRARTSGKFGIRAREEEACSEQASELCIPAKQATETDS